jgi:lysophospholipase L1-like esterase
MPILSKLQKLSQLNRVQHHLARKSRPFCVLVLLSVLAACTTLPATAPPVLPPAGPPLPPPTPLPPLMSALPPGPFAAEIYAFAVVDSELPPNTCSILFVGSSSIRFWKSLQADMAPAPTLNRGFGGAQVSDVNLYFDRVVAKYQPRAIFFYAGENDLAAGKSPDQIVADFKTFLDLKTASLGSVPVTFISLKPSRLRFTQMQQQGQINQAIQTLSMSRSDLSFVDVASSMLENGIPKDIYREDGLHMTPEGYALWSTILKPKVESSLSAQCPAAPFP